MILKSREPFLAGVRERNVKTEVGSEKGNIAALKMEERGHDLASKKAHDRADTFF